MAAAGGIELLLTPYLHIAFSKAEVLSDEGASYVFDEKAKGFVPGEGAGLVLLKDFDEAIRDGDDIYGVIIGSALNNDGHTMGLTVPGKEGQKDVIRSALKKSGVSAESVTYLEAHGTGTLLGDPIEILAATEVFREYTDKRQFCAVGSVKSNMGHLMRASGIAGFIKVILSLKNRVIPPTLNCTTPHPRFKFSDSPFYPIVSAQTWSPKNGIRRAGISSCRFGGTNCHIIVEEYARDSIKNIKTALPLPVFKHRYFRLDESDREKSSALDDIELMNILESLQDGTLNTADAAKLMKIDEIKVQQECDIE